MKLNLLLNHRIEMKIKVQLKELGQEMVIVSLQIQKELGPLLLKRVIKSQSRVLSKLKQSEKSGRKLIRKSKKQKMKADSSKRFSPL